MPKVKRSRPAHTRAQGWCFTVNNPEYLPFACDFPDVTYMVYQEEIAPETGTYHLQGYIRFAARKTFSVVQGYFGDLAPHLETASGSPAQNKVYCTKESSRLPGSEPYEFGECPKVAPGQRNDILALRDAIKSGKSFKEIADDDDTCGTLARHMPFYNRLVVEASPPVQRPDLRVTLCVGPAGAGKSTCAGLFDSEVPTYVYDRSLNGFWDGYTGQTKLIFDEMSGSTLKPTEFNRICDKGPFIANIKGSSRYLECTDIRITSNFMPEHWWAQGTKWTPDALYRRIHECHYHPKVGTTHKWFSNDSGRAIDHMRAFLEVMNVTF